VDEKEELCQDEKLNSHESSHGRNVSPRDANCGACLRQLEEKLYTGNIE